jgi:hypothetical protein
LPYDGIENAIDECNEGLQTVGIASIQAWAGVDGIDGTFSPNWNGIGDHPKTKDGKEKSEKGLVGKREHW